MESKQNSKHKEVELTRLHKEYATKACLDMIEDFKEVVYNTVEKEVPKGNY